MGSDAAGKTTVGGNEGIALVAVLWALTLLAIVAATLTLETRSSTRIARNMVDRAAAREAADAGVQRAILDLTASPSAEAKMFRADGTVYNWRFADSAVRISIRDELRKANLNQAPEGRLASVFGSLGFDPEEAQSLADAIADFRDPDNLRHHRGAEADDYRAAGLPWGPKNAPFQTIEELKQVFGVTKEIYQRVAPELSVFSFTDVQDFVGRPRRTYSIRAEVKGPNGAMFAREAVVQLSGLDPFMILDWRRGDVANAEASPSR